MTLPQTIKYKLYHEDGYYGSWFLQPENAQTTFLLTKNICEESVFDIELNGEYFPNVCLIYHSWTHQGHGGMDESYGDVDLSFITGKGIQIKISPENKVIAWWKEKETYEYNRAKRIKELVTGIADIDKIIQDFQNKKDAHTQELKILMERIETF